jgi:hypothetical protein
MAEMKTGDRDGLAQRRDGEMGREVDGEQEQGEEACRTPPQGGSRQRQEGQQEVGSHEEPVHQADPGDGAEQPSREGDRPMPPAGGDRRGLHRPGGGTQEQAGPGHLGEETAFPLAPGAGEPEAEPPAQVEDDRPAGHLLERHSEELEERPPDPVGVGGLETGPRHPSNGQPPHDAVYRDGGPEGHGPSPGEGLRRMEDERPEDGEGRQGEGRQSRVHLGSGGGRPKSSRVRSPGGTSCEIPSAAA